VWEAAHPREDLQVGEDSTKPLYLHFIAHTHDDVGWLKTVDEYYVGARQRTQQAEVHLILTNVVNELWHKPWRKFTYVEIKFFTMWWRYQSDETKGRVRTLVQEGRFEFVNAGWSMHDEACPHYEDMINNMMKGHEFVLEEFGVKPRIGWQVDPFGHSDANARLFADMGFEAWVFARLDGDDKGQRFKDKAMEFLWRPSAAHFGKEKQIFTTAMRDHYCWTDGQWVDERFPNDDPTVTDESLDTFNANMKMKKMVDYAREMEKNYRGSHLLIPFGCDFSFANARMNFEEMDKLITWINKHTHEHNITVFYSTPGEYLDA